MDAVTWRGLRRFAAYALLTLAPVIWLGAVLQHTYASEVDRTALRDGAAQAQMITSSAIEPFLGSRSLEIGLSGAQRAEMANAAAAILQSGAILRLRVRGLDGAVMFDAAHPFAAAGEPQPDDDIDKAIASGILVSRTRVDADEVDGNASDGTRAIEAYVTVYASANPALPIGVVEVYVPYDPIAELREQSLARMRAVLIAGLAALWVVLALVVWSVGRRIRRQSEHTEYLALHDSLTGLPNRALFADRVASALSAAARTGTDVALVVVDLDRFKEVNDTLGHRNGDEFLRIIAGRLTGALRSGDTIARLGADEFGIVLQSVTDETVEPILQRLQDAINQEVELAGVAVSAEASMGYAMWPLDAGTADTLLQRADLALDAAKAVRASVVRYHSRIDGFDPQRLVLVAELRRAIHGGELVLHYQPKVEARSGTVVAFEALVRWQHPVRGLLPPVDFLPIAESTGLIGPLTQWVVETALTQLGEWSRERPDLSMAVNVSARNLRDGLPAWIMQRLEAHGIEPGRLVLEITETSFATDPLRATTLIEELSAAGVVVSLDDFGQGYTSLGSLGHLPVSELKIDRGFVVAMQSNPEDRAIVASVIELGHQLGLRVVAEGVENEAVRADLCGLGCDTMQGYLFSPPVPAAAALRLASRQPARLPV